MLGYLDVGGEGDFSVLIRSAFRWDSESESPSTSSSLPISAAATGPPSRSEEKSPAPQAHQARRLWQHGRRERGRNSGRVGDATVDHRGRRGGHVFEHRGRGVGGDECQDEEHDGRVWRDRVGAIRKNKWAGGGRLGPNQKVGGLESGIDSLAGCGIGEVSCPLSPHDNQF